MKKEKFTKEVVTFYNEFFNNGEHDILYVNSSNVSQIRDDIKLKQSEVMVCENSLLKNLKKIHYIIKKYQYIVLHSFSIFDNVQKILLLPYLSRIIWIEWGDDLYNWTPRGKAKMLTVPVNRILREKIYGVVCIFPPDIDFYKKTFPNSKAKIFYAPYVGGVKSNEPDIDYKYFDKISEKKRNGCPLYIMVGHNGQEQLNHISVLNKLLAYKNENIRIVLSLSYGGTKKYVDEVKDFAIKGFGNKAIILDGFVPKEEYFDFLKKIDIAVFDTERQTGLANVNTLLFNNVKIFMNKNCTMWGFFEDAGFPLYDSDMIGKVDYSIFSEEVLLKHEDSIVKYFERRKNFEISVNYWRNIYQEI